MPGPPPKRSDERRRRNAPQHPTKRVDGAADHAPELDMDDIHPLAAHLYEVLSSSVESKFFTPAIWERARVAAFVLSNFLRQGRLSSQMYVAIQADWKSFLVDPAEQLRLGIEVQRASVSDPDEDASVTALAAYRRDVGA